MKKMIRMNKKNKKDKVDRRLKTNEILSRGYDGLPQKFKLVLLNADPPYDRELVPMYEKCVCCNLSLGRIEEECNVELGGYCLGCFKIVTEQKDDQPFGEFLCPVGKCSQVKLVEIKDPIKIMPRQPRSLKKRGSKHG